MNLNRAIPFAFCPIAHARKTNKPCSTRRISHQEPFFLPCCLSWHSSHHLHFHRRTDPSLPQELRNFDKWAVSDGNDSRAGNLLRYVPSCRGPETSPKPQVALGIKTNLEAFKTRRTQQLAKTPYTIPQNRLEAQGAFINHPITASSIAATRPMDSLLPRLRPLFTQKQLDDTQLEIARDKKKPEVTTKQARLHRGRRFVSDSESDEEWEQHVADAGSQHSAASTPPDTSSIKTLVNIVNALAAFPVGEVAYGTDSILMPRPDIEMLNHGIVKPPYDRDQLHSIKKFAKELRAKRFGINWEITKRTPTWCVQLSRRGEYD